MKHHPLPLIIAAAWAMTLGSEAFAEPPAPVRALVSQYCLGCHDADTARGGLNLAVAVSEEIGQQPQVREKVVRRLRVRHMPPEG